MPRPIWKGHISFGLVNVPVTLYPAEQRTDLQFHMIDSRNQARIRYERVNEETGEEVRWDQIVKGYEFDGGNYVFVTDEDLKAAAPEATRTIDIEGFVDLDSIDLVYFDRPYYLEPGKRGEKGYALLREVLEKTGKAGIAKVVIRTRQYLAALVPRGDALVLNLLRYNADLRSPKDLDLPHGSAKALGISPGEVKMAETLVNSMTTDWKPDEFRDEYRDALKKYIAKKARAGEAHEVATPQEIEEEIPETYNIMDLLQQSVSERGGGRGNGRRNTAGRTAKKKKKTAARKTKTKTRARRKAG